jgi:hypothetical protein
MDGLPTTARVSSSPGSFSSGALRHLAEFVDGHAFEQYPTPVIDGHPRIIGTISAANG